METLGNNIKVLIIAANSFICYYLGGYDGLLGTLIMFVVIDYATGVMRAVAEKKLSSKIGARGIMKKMLIFLFVGIAQRFDRYLFSDSEMLRTAVIFFYISNEGISLLENANAIGLPIPEKLKNALAQLKTKGGGKDE